MIGFIKNLLSGMLSFLTGLLGGKKSLESKTSPNTAKKRKNNGYFMELDEAEAAKPVQPKEPAKVAPVAAKAKKAEKTELVQTAQGLKAEPVKPASTNTQKQTETTFAPKYLIPSASSNGRRRPGPSMNNFLDMARQVKTPN